MAKPAYAVVEMLCNPALLAQLEAIPNLKIEVRPIRTPDPALIRIGALADDAAQAAARNLGCVVTVVKSADDYRRQIEEAYRDLGKDQSGPR
jgi:alkanesulfonate monooxygenase SsuD/methylene tetrahydromethanopterin reductase-like flavin-dependent oxidoreductase (luciferase family)